MHHSKLTEHFWINDGKLLYLGNNNYFKVLEKQKGIGYALDICAEPVFGCRLYDDGDPGIETSSDAIADNELLSLFIKEIRSSSRDD